MGIPRRNNAHYNTIAVINDEEKERARCMCIMGAELLFSPTGIGSDCHDHWQTVVR
jgi:predicted amidohydrolase